MTRKSHFGATLVELVVAITVISMAAATIVGLLSFMSRSSAEGMATAQSAQVASAYLNQILAEDFQGSTDRISPYDGDLYTGVSDATGTSVSGLENYRVSVEVQTPALIAFPDSVTGNDVRLVTVVVTDPLGGIVRLSGIRTRRPP